MSRPRPITMIPSRLRLSLLIVLVAGLAGCATLPMAASPAGGPLAAELNALFDDPDLAHAHWGVLVETLDTGERIYARNAERLFVPASNMKVITGAAALETLGPEYRYLTTVSAGGAVRNGVLEGSLVVTGTGDPTISGRFLDDPRDLFRSWADSLRAHGISRVEGGIIAVDTAFRDHTLGSGWMWDDLAGSSSAEFGALQFNEGVIQLDIFPSSTELQPAIVVLDPPSQYVRIVNDTRTLPPGSVTAIEVARDDAGSTLIVRGQVPMGSDGATELVAVRNPALYFASMLRETLREQGVMVEGPATHHAAIGLLNRSVDQAVPLFTHQSPPLAQILAAMMKPSQNQIAETLLLTVGREVGGEATAVAAVAVVDSLLGAWGVEDRRMRMADGSGLSRYNLLSPQMLVAVLRHMAQSPYRDAWIAALPVAGRDGTLQNRMSEAPLLDRVEAKTGSLSNVRTLSGYLTAASGERLVFSTMINGNLAGAAAADEVAEAALEAVARSR